MLLGALAGGAAQAATKVTSFSVSVTVVESCTVAAGAQASGPACQPAPAAPQAAGQTGAQATIVAREPVVTVSQDPKTGARIRTVAF